MLKDQRILIADQHIHVRNWMREQLSIIGATSIATASNASEMMRLCHQQVFDVIVCDHHLDHKRDGQQLLEELRYGHTLPLRSVFIIATAERKYKQVIAAAEFAPDDYLIKPYTPAQLSIRLNRALRKKKAMRHVFEHLESCDHEAAVIACDKVLRTSPRYVLDALRIKAESLIALGRVEEASALYNSITSTRAVPWARMGYAMTLQRQKRFSEAKDEAYRLNEEHPEFMSVYDLLANLHEELGELSEAIQCLERAAAITSTHNTERLRRIADLAERAGDHAKVTHTLKQVVERTKRSSMLKVDDYLGLTRSLLHENQLDEAEKTAAEMRTNTTHLPEGELASEVAVAMVHRTKQNDHSAKQSMARVAELYEMQEATLTDTLAIEIAEESAHHGEVKRTASILAKLSRKVALPGRIKSRLSNWFGSTRNHDGDKSSSAVNMATVRKAVFLEQIILGLSESITALEDNWSDTTSAAAREKLIDAFTLMPRDARVIDAHIRYNSLAVINGAERHAPTTRAQTGAAVPA